MQRPLSLLFALGIGLTPVFLQSCQRPIWVQTQNISTQEVERLLNLALQQTQQGKPQQAIETFQQVLAIARQKQDRKVEAAALLGIGLNLSNIGQPQKALDYYNQALPIRREVGDRAGVAATLNNIGFVYSGIGQPQKALDYYNQALPIFREVGNRTGVAATLNNIGLVYSGIGQPQKALDYYNQALPIFREVGDRTGVATTLNNIGAVYTGIGQPQKALDYYNQALPIIREVGDRTGVATTLNNIGKVYSDIGQPQKALDYYNQALPIFREVGDRTGVATTLNNIGGVYSDIGQPQKALDYYNQALPIRREVGDRSTEARTLSNIGAVYRDIGQLSEATTNFEQSVILTLEIRGGLNRGDRSQFLQAEQGTSIALVDILIKQNKAASAYQWANLATTADLIEYTRLINAQIKDPAARQAIDGWNQENQQLQTLRNNLQQKFSETLSREMRQQETKVNQLAEDISKQYPEVAELFETKPTDIAQLQASIPVGTTVINPILLTNSIALFVLTRDKLTVTKVPLDGVDIDALVQQTYQQVTNRKDADYEDNLTKLYQLLIQPIAAQIQATNPKQLSFIATGKLRYIPFEALFDGEKYLIEKYPISYLTRLSVRSLQTANKINSPSPKRVLAFGNPRPVKPLALDGAETEVQKITQILPGSEAFIRDKATLDTFKTQAPRFSLLHLATHGCFQRGGCPQLGLEENILVFAGKNLNIADAALLGLENVDLITLSACQTALTTDTQGKAFADTAEPISGLAYIFERAGAKAIISSLWSAEDKTTQEMMVQFYNNLKQGMSKSEALRQAKLSQINRHPFFWSPFVLIGDAQ